MPDPLELNGLDGSNPLGFLAALGTLALCERLGLEPRMRWVEYANSHRPRLTIELQANTLTEALTETLRRDLADGPPAWCDADIIKRSANDYRTFAASAAEGNDSTTARFAAAFASDAARDESGENVTPSQLSFANGQSGKLLLRDYRDLIEGLDDDHIAVSLYQPWQNADASKSFRWEPRDLRLYALRADDPGSSTVYTTHGANVLAFWAFAMLPSFPTAAGLATAGFSRQADASGRRSECLTWPIWRDPLSCDAVRSLMLHPLFADVEPDREAATALGLLAVQRSRRVTYQKGLFFQNSVAV